MLDALDKWMLCLMVPAARRLAPDDLSYLMRLWKRQVGWRRYVRLLFPLSLIAALVAGRFVPFSGLVIALTGGAIVIAALLSCAMVGYLEKVFRQIWFEEQYCLHCGYDLHSTITAGKRECPECGREFNPRAYPQHLNRHNR